MAAIHYHFGSKKGLFEAVLARRIRPLKDERLRRLEALEVAAGGRPLALESIIDAVFHPALESIQESGREATWVKLIGWFRLEPGDHWQAAKELHDPSISRFLQAFAVALPHLPREEVAYRLYFLLGTEVNTLIDTLGPAVIDKRLSNIYEDPEGVMTRLISFVAAGMRAPLVTKETSNRSRRRDPREENVASGE